MPGKKEKTTRRESVVVMIKQFAMRSSIPLTAIACLQVAALLTAGCEWNIATPQLVGKWLHTSTTTAGPRATSASILELNANRSWRLIEISRDGVSQQSSVHAERGNRWFVNQAHELHLTDRGAEHSIIISITSVSPAELSFQTTDGPIVATRYRGEHDKLISLLD